MALKRIFSKTIRMKGTSAGASKSLLDTDNTNALTRAEVQDYAPFNDFLIQNLSAVSVQGNPNGNTNASGGSGINAPIVAPSGNNEGWSVNTPSEIKMYSLYDLPIQNIDSATATADNSVIVTISKVIEV